MKGSAGTPTTSGSPVWARKVIGEVHLVEATAPTDSEIASKVRPWLANCLQLGGPSVRLLRHDLPWPLVKRLVHAGSNMKRMSTNDAFFLESRTEIEELVQTYGRVPW